MVKFKTVQSSSGFRILTEYVCMSQKTASTSLQVVGNELKIIDNKQKFLLK